MTINSVQYFIFFLIVFCLYYFTVSRKWNVRARVLLLQLLILAAGIFFYSMSGLFILLTLSYAVIITYIAGLVLEKHRTRAVTALFIILLLAPLCFFKYYNFAGGIFGMPHLDLIVPLGISFYTLQCITYIAAVSKAEMPAEKNILTVAVFTSFFPVISSGPIMRAKKFIPQLKDLHPFDYETVTQGLIMIGCGLLRKMVIADSIGTYIDKVYSSLDSSSGTAVLLAVCLYSFQIYFDFSGYSDMAVGSAKMLGFDVGVNFTRPYLSRNMSEFWHNWHISLSTWLRDYIYIPTGGSRVSAFRSYVNLMITFLVSGLWHGAAWHFVIWGGIHGVFLCGERVVRNFRKSRGLAVSRALHIHNIIYTYILATFAWIFFRVEKTGDVITVFSRIATIPYDIRQGIDGTVLMMPRTGSSDYYQLQTAIIAMIAVCAVGCLTRGHREHFSAVIRRYPVYVRWGTYILIVFLIYFFSAKQVSANFIYSQF